RVCRKIGSEFGPEKINQHWYHQSPRENAAGKLDRRQTQTNDVPHPEICRTHAGRGEHGCPAGRYHVCASQRTKPDLRVSEIADAEVKVLVGSKQAEFPQHVYNAAHADIPEEVLGGLCPALSSFVDL